MGGSEKSGLTISGRRIEFELFGLSVNKSNDTKEIVNRFRYYIPNWQTTNEKMAFFFFQFIFSFAVFSHTATEEEAFWLLAVSFMTTPKNDND